MAIIGFPHEASPNCGNCCSRVRDGISLVSHRQTPPLDPAADARSYRAALLNRYDRQIRLLSGVKYWYVLPLYSWILLSIMTTIPAHDAKRRIVAGIIPTAFSLFVIWLNEIYAVKKLRLKRMQVEELLDEGKS